MKDTKLLRLLKLLTKQEKKQLRKAVQSPLFNTNLAVINLYEILEEQYPDITGDNAEYFSKIYPEEKFDDLRIRRLLSALTKVIEDLLVYLETKNDEGNRARLLTESYGRRGQFSDFSRGIVRQNELLEEMPMKNMNYWAEKMRLYDQLYTNVQHNKYDKTDHTPENLMDAADRFFAFAKVRYGLVLKSKGKIFQSEHPILFREAIEKEHVNGLLKDNELFLLYHAAEQLTDTPSEDNFTAYERLFFENADVVTGDDRLFLFYVGLNYIIRQKNSGDNRYNAIALNWYKLFLQRDMFVQTKFIDTNTFNNIVYFGCETKDFIWVENFINTYTDKLPKSIRENERLYNHAVVSFHKKEYAAVIENLDNYSFSANYVRKTKVLLLRSYFEKFLIDSEYSTLLFSTIKSFEIFLLRDKNLTAVKKEPHLNFCKILNKLSLLILKGVDKKEIEIKITKNIQHKKRIVAKKWLMNKIKTTE